MTALLPSLHKEDFEIPSHKLLRQSTPLIGNTVGTLGGLGLVSSLARVLNICNLFLPGN